LKLPSGIGREAYREKWGAPRRARSARL